MKMEVVKENALMNYLIRKIGIICHSPDQKCLCHIYLHNLMQVFVYKNNSLTHKKKKLKRLNQKKKIPTDYY